jgi:hypothetical protein
MLAKGLIPAAVGNLPVDILEPIAFPGWSDRLLEEINQWFIGRAHDFWQCVQDGMPSDLLDVRRWPRMLAKDGTSLADGLAECFERTFSGMSFWHHVWKLPLAIDTCNPDSPKA